MAMEVPNDLGWYQDCVLRTLADRAAVQKVHGLPMQVFHLVGQVHSAFRMLQNGQNVGKVVVLVGTKHTASALDLDLDALRTSLHNHTQRASDALDMAQLDEAYALLETLCQQHVSDAMQAVHDETAIPKWHHRLLYSWCAKQSPPAGPLVSAAAVLSAHPDLWPEVALAERCGPVSYTHLTLPTTPYV